MYKMVRRDDFVKRFDGEVSSTHSDEMSIVRTLRDLRLLSLHLH